MDDTRWDWEKVKAMAEFAWRDDKRLLVAGLLVLIIVSFIVLPLCGAEGHTAWWTYVEPIIGILTLSLATIIWVGQIDDRWKNSLPKELTVLFTFNDKALIRCERAYLASEADIRAWAQQLGRQIVAEQAGKSEDLVFYPDIRQEPSLVKFLDGGYVMSYSVVYKLRRLPTGFTDMYEQNRSALWKKPDYTLVVG